MMQQPMNPAYVCLDAIGNSLNLEEMLNDIITTFISISGAEGGAYISTHPHPHAIIEIGSRIPFPSSFPQNIDGYTVHRIAPDSSLLDIPIGSEHFLFLLPDNAATETYGKMFAGFRTKITNAIDACRNQKRLYELESALKNQVHRNDANEKMMISQSRMAIMGEMIGMIAHQWRQPITIIGLITNNTILNIQLGEMNQDNLVNDLELIDKQVHFLSRTIDDFRNFFRPNKLPQRVEYGEICDDILSIMYKGFESQKIALTFHGDRDISLTTYKNELMQVFLNILNNAKDAFEEHRVNAPAITFESRMCGEKVLFLISDNAGGIDSQIIEKIFEPYFSTKGEKHGTGIGLYMSAIIIEKHLGGSIRVCSDRSGTTFALLIPTRSDEEFFHVD